MTAAEMLEAADPVCLEDVRAHARAVLEPGIWDFVEGGSGTERVMAANRAAFAEVALVPRVLTGVAEADPRTRLLGG
ncbi:alpha-hydroxy-acid oxidizing protein, partial [Streptomyces sp. HCCB10043]